MHKTQSIADDSPLEHSVMSENPNHVTGRLPESTVPMVKSTAMETKLLTVNPNVLLITMPE